MRPFRRRPPFVPQLEVVECGAAALAMVLAYHGCEVDLQEVRETCGVSRDGVTALDIVTAAEAYGLAYDAVRATVDDFCVLPTPAILHWENRHFVVLERVQGSTVALIDPAFGPFTMPLANVAAHFSGVALLFKPAAGFQRRRARRRGVARFYLAPVSRALMQSVLFSALMQPLAIALPILTRLAIDRAITAAGALLIVPFSAAIVLAIAGTALLAFARSYVLQNVQATTDVRVMRQFVRHLLTLPLSFFLARRPGDLLYRLNCNATIRELLSSSIVASALDLFLVIAYIGLLCVQDVGAALLVGAFLVVRAVLIHTARNRNRRVIHAELAASAAEGETLAEALAAFETIRARHAEEFVIDRWTARAVGRWNAFAQRKQTDLDSESLLAFTDGLGVACLVAYAGLKVTSGAMTIGGFGMLLMLQMLLKQPLDAMLTAAQNWQLVENHIRRIHDVMFAKSERRDGRRIDLRGGVALDGVSFRYARRAPWVIAGATIHIAPGETVALVGRSGEGKSTMARLMLGLHEAEHGRILFDGNDVRELDVASLRAQIGVVTQEPFLLNASVAFNITLGDPEIDDATMREAARVACIDDVVNRLPQGFGTMIGESGRLLSGGERQRIAIARAVARRPRILLLDEATSALDCDCEQRVQERLAELHCTRIIIAHRPQAIAGADRVIVVDHQTITEVPHEPQLAEAAR